MNQNQDQAGRFADMTRELMRDIDDYLAELDAASISRNVSSETSGTLAGLAARTYEQENQT